MKKNPNILSYMHKKDAKSGIPERKVPNGYFLFAKVVYIISLSASAITGLLAVLGRYIISVDVVNNKIDGALNREQLALFNSAKLTLVLVPLCVAVMIFGAVMLFKKHTVPTLASVLAGGGGMLLILTVISSEAFSDVGSPMAYIWRHAVPLGVYIIFSLIYCIWDLILKYKENRAYKEFTARLYEAYGGHELSEDEWEEFLNNYNPSAFR